MSVARSAAEVLRDRKISALFYPHPYFGMFAVAPGAAEEAIRALSTIDWLLTDRTTDLLCKGYEHVTQLGAYELWRANGRQRVHFGQIESPNGVESVNGQPLMWIGDKVSKVSVLSNGSGVIELTADYFLGPSLAGGAPRTLEITGNGEHPIMVTFDQNARHTFSVPVVPGRNLIGLRTIERPDVAEQPNGDPRPLMLAMVNYKLCLE
jgi:hypothetical protein